MMVMVSAKPLPDPVSRPRVAVLEPLRDGCAAARFRPGHRGGDEVFHTGRAGLSLLLYGMSMLYGATGTLELNAVSDAISQGVQNRRC